MIKWDFFQRYKDDSTSATQSAGYATLTKWKIKIIWSSRYEKIFNKIQYLFMTKKKPLDKMDIEGMYLNKGHLW